MDIVEGILERKGATLKRGQAVRAALGEGIELENGMTWDSMLTSVVGPLRGTDLGLLLLLLMSMASYWYNLLFRVSHNRTSSPSVMPRISPLVVYSRSRGC